MLIELPGKEVGKVQVLSMGGSSITDEYSFVSLIEGSVDSSNLAKYEIQNQ